MWKRKKENSIKVDRANINQNWERLPESIAPPIRKRSFDASLTRYRYVAQGSIENYDDLNDFNGRSPEKEWMNGKFSAVSLVVSGRVGLDFDAKGGERLLATRTRCTCVALKVRKRGRTRQRRGKRKRRAWEKERDEERRGGEGRKDERDGAYAAYISIGLLGTGCFIGG